MEDPYSRIYKDKQDYTIVKVSRGWLERHPEEATRYLAGGITVFGREYTRRDVVEDIVGSKNLMLFAERILRTADDIEALTDETVINELMESTGLDGMFVSKEDTLKYLR